jgi:hypothetical protein
MSQSWQAQPKLKQRRSRKETLWSRSKQKGDSEQAFIDDGASVSPTFLIAMIAPSVRIATADERGRYSASVQQRYFCSATLVRMNLEDVVMMIFHESADCPGVITSDDTGQVRCAECGNSVGQLDRLVPRDLIGMLSRVSSSRR